MAMMDEQRELRCRGLDILIPVLLIGLVTAFFFFSKWDLWLLEPFFDEVSGTFPLNRAIGPRVLYYLAPVFGVGMAAVGLAVGVGGAWVKSWRPFRKEAAFLFLLVALGPGLFVNGIFKEHYGRPRPNQCKQFGGEMAYQPVLAYVNHHSAQKFRSFPCGHASIGFAMMGPYFFLRYRRRSLARMFMAGGLLLGLATGCARMIEGRHFASDVIWAGAMVYFIGIMLARAFGFYKCGEPSAPAK